MADEEQAVLEEEQITPEEEAVEVEEVAEEVADSPDLETEESEEFVEITLGDESLTSKEEEPAPDWVKDLRKTQKETSRENKELKRKLEEIEAAKAQQQAAPQITAKPTLEAHDYDSDKYEAALGQWYDQQRKQREIEQAQLEAQRQQQAEWQEKMNSYEKAKVDLGVKDYEDAEALATELFNDQQQGIILQGADNPALSVYALGKNSKKAKELAAIKDPVKFAFAVAKLEAQLKVNKRKAKPQPEGRVATGGKKPAVDSTLQRLEAEADRTGNRTKVAAYKRKLRQKTK